MLFGHTRADKVHALHFGLGEMENSRSINTLFFRWKYSRDRFVGSQRWDFKRANICERSCSNQIYEENGQS